MAVTVTTQQQNPTELIADVEATADADVAAVIPHGFGQAPLAIELVPLQTEFFTSAPNLGVVDATNINLVMQNAVGSGVAGDQIRVIARLPENVTR